MSFEVSMVLHEETTVGEMAIIDLTFLAPLPKECRCLMCEQLMRDPCHLTCCNSRYCRKCVDRLLVSNHQCMNSKCQSRNYQVEVSGADLAVKWSIDMLLVYCPMKINGCLWTGHVKDVESHLKWGEFERNDMSCCRYLPVPCTNDCGVGVPRRDMENHRQVECANRSAKCPDCGLEGIAGEIEVVHRGKCQFRVAECPDGCGMPGIRQSSLSHHLSEECPLRLVSCGHVGCDEQFCLKDRYEHDKEYFREHFQLVSEKVQCLSKENEELRSLALSVQHMCIKLQEQYSTLLSVVLSQDLDSSDGYFVVNKQSKLVSSEKTEIGLPPVCSRTKSMKLVLPTIPPRCPIILPPNFNDLIPSNASSPDCTDFMNWKPKTPELEPPSLATKSETTKKPTPPPKPERRDSLSNAVLQKKNRIPPPVKAKPTRSRNISMPNLLLEESELEGLVEEDDDYQRRSRTWSWCDRDNGGGGGVASYSDSLQWQEKQNPCYSSRNSSRYERGTNCASRISSSVTSADESDNDLSLFCENSNTVRRGLPLLKRQWKSEDHNDYMHPTGMLENHLQMSRSNYMHPTGNHFKSVDHDYMHPTGNHLQMSKSVDHHYMRPAGNRLQMSKSVDHDYMRPDLQMSKSVDHDCMRPAAMLGNHFQMSKSSDGIYLNVASVDPRGGGGGGIADRIGRLRNISDPVFRAAYGSNPAYLRSPTTTNTSPEMEDTVFHHTLQTY